MKLYLAFSFYEYYPSGGAADLVGVFRGLEEASLAARRAVKEQPCTGSYNILEIDTETLRAEEVEP